MKKAGELLGTFFDDNLMSSARAYSEFFSAWKRIVGEHIAAHSRIVELEKTVLVVEADHPGWIQLIQMKRTSILDSIRGQFPELTVTALSIRLKKDGAGHSPRRPIEKAPESPKPEDQVQGSSSDGAVVDPYSSISDDSFKDLLKRLEQSIKNSSR